MSARVMLDVALAEDLLADFLAHMRCFGIEHPGKVHFQISVQTQQSTEAVTAMLDALNFPHRATWSKH